MKYKQKVLTICFFINSLKQKTKINITKMLFISVSMRFKTS